MFPKPFDMQFDAVIIAARNLEEVCNQQGLDMYKPSVLKYVIPHRCDGGHSKEDSCQILPRGWCITETCPLGTLGLVGA
jgi:hypothetical protein